MRRAIAGEALPVALTVAGSDSGGGAGIQADLKTFMALGCFGTVAITCVTAQNPDAVTGIEALSPAMVALQIRTVRDGFPVAAAKTGMLYSCEIVEAVAVALDGVPHLVVDPVMVATSGARLLRDDAIDALCRRLLPMATVITPNTAEAAILAGGAPIRTLDDQRSAADTIARRFGTACVVKGGHLPPAADLAGDAPEAPRLLNVLATGAAIRVVAAPWIETRSTHGTGCTFAAALAAFLARGRNLFEAVDEAGRYVARVLAASRPAGRQWVADHAATGSARRGVP